MISFDNFNAFQLSTLDLYIPYPVVPSFSMFYPVVVLFVVGSRITSLQVAPLQSKARTLTKVLRLCFGSLVGEAKAWTLSPIQYVLSGFKFKALRPAPVIWILHTYQKEFWQSPLSPPQLLRSNTSGNACADLNSSIK